MPINPRDAFPTNATQLSSTFKWEDGDNWDVIPIIDATGITHVGLRIDFHNQDAKLISTDDYDWRISAGIDNAPLDFINDAGTEVFSFGNDGNLTMSGTTITYDSNGTPTVLDLTGLATDTDLTNHVNSTNIHIDWTVDQGATNIHPNNYTDTDTTYVSSDFDHDQLTNFVAAEHIDWSVTGLEVIHTDRYTNTTYVSSDFDHDQLTNFVAAEHIDWTVDQGVTNIHPNNYTDTDTTYVSSDFDHDQLQNFVANEHIDWTTDQGATNIDPGNYVNTTYVNSDWDHDQLTNYVAAEHVDWSLASQGTIHPTNYVDTNTTYVSSDFNHDDLTGFVAAEHVDWTLSSQGTIHSTNLPALALTDVFTVASEAAQIALTAQEGDVAIRTDENKSYIHNGGVAGTIADWSELLTPTDAVISVDGQTGAVDLSGTYQPIGSYANLSGSLAQDFNIRLLTLANMEKTDNTVAGRLSYDANDADTQTTLGTFASTDPAGLYLNDSGSVVNTIWHTGHFEDSHVANWQTAYGWGDHASEPYAVTDATNTFLATQLISNNEPALNLAETDTTTNARLVLSGGDLFVQAGAQGSGATTSSGDIRFTGYFSSDVGAFTVRSSGAHRDILHTGNFQAGIDYAEPSALNNVAYTNANNDFSVQQRINAGIHVNTATGTNNLEISRSGASTDQVLSIGVTDTTVDFKYTEDTTNEGVGNFGAYRFILSGNSAESSLTALSFDENDFTVNTDATFNSNSFTIQSPNTIGDTTLNIIADGDNSTEGDHPSIRLKQDGNLVDFRIGFGIDDADTGAGTANSLVITNITSEANGGLKYSPNNGTNVYDILHEGLRGTEYAAVAGSSTSSGWYDMPIYTSGLLYNSTESPEYQPSTGDQRNYGSLYLNEQWGVSLNAISDNFRVGTNEIFHEGNYPNELLYNNNTTVDLNTLSDGTPAGSLNWSVYNATSTNKPPHGDNANGVLTLGVHTGATYKQQLAFSSDGNMYFRDNPNGNHGTWRKVYDDSHASLDNLAYTNVNNNFSTSQTINGDIGSTGVISADTNFRVDSSGALLTINNTAWTNAPNHDVLRNGYGTNTGDYVYLKASGNSTGDHGQFMVADNGFAYGRTDNEQGALANSLSDPITNTSLYFDHLNEELYIGGALIDKPGVKSVTGGGDWSFFPRVQGGELSIDTSSQVGAIRIDLPVLWTSHMISFWVDVFDYADNETCSFQIAGYNYAGTTDWHTSSSARQFGGNTSYNVYFGATPGTATKSCVYIGETTSNWNYPKVVVRDVMVGFGVVNNDTWQDGWAVSIDNTARTNVSETRTDVKVLDSFSGGTVGGALTVNGIVDSDGYEVSANDSGNLFRSFNTSAGSAEQLQILHANAHTEIRNLRGHLQLDGPSGFYVRMYYNNVEQLRIANGINESFVPIDLNGTYLTGTDRIAFDTSNNPNIDTYQNASFWETGVSDTDAGTRPANFLHVVNTGGTGTSRGMQLAAAYGSDNNGFYIRRRSDNVGSENGANVWQDWRQIMTKEYADTLYEGTITKSTSGNRHGVYPYINSDGITDVGRSLDFYYDDTSTDDFDWRIATASPTNGSMTWTNDSGAVVMTLSSAGDLTLANQLVVPSNIVHDGDPDTYINFSTNLQRFYCGGEQVLQLDTAQSIFRGNLACYTPDIDGSYSTAPIEVREADLVGSTQTGDDYAPAIAFHWGNRNQGKLWFQNVSGDKELAWTQGNAGNYASTDYSIRTGILKADQDLTVGGNRAMLENQGTVATDFDNYTETGHYYVSNWSPTILNGPVGSYNWGSLRVTQFNGSSYVLQEYWPHNTDGCWTRTRWGGTWTGWREIFASTSDGSGSGLNADLLDGLHASSFVRGDGVDNGSIDIVSNDADFIVADDTDSTSNYIWRDHSASALYLGTSNAVVTTRSNLLPGSDSTYALGSSSTRWLTLFADTMDANQWRAGEGGNQLVINAGESASYATAQTGEYLYVNAENGMQINSSPDNWGSGWAGRNTATICDVNGDTTFPDLTQINFGAKEAIRATSSFLYINASNNFGNGVWLSGSNLTGGNAEWGLGGAGTPSQSQIYMHSNTGNATTPNIELNGGTGHIQAITKSFDIEHPTKEGMRLKHGVLEGPEHGVYVRGKLDGSDTIELPDYWTGLVHEDTVTVQLTAIGGKQDLWIEDIVDNKVIVGSDAESIKCFYYIQAERKDIDRFDIEYTEE